MTAFELIEILKNVDPLTPVVVEINDTQVGYHFKQLRGFKITTIRMTEVEYRDYFVDKVIKEKRFLGCNIEKPNAFKALAIRL